MSLILLMVSRFGVVIFTGEAEVLSQYERTLLIWCLLLRSGRISCRVALDEFDCKCDFRSITQSHFRIGDDTGK